MVLIWRSMNAYELVVEGAEPTEDAQEEEIRAYQNACHQAAVVYIQVVSPAILEKIVELPNPHAMWIYLRSEYYRDTAFALVSQVASLASLSTAYDRSIPISTFILQFKTKWLRLYKLAKSSSDGYRQSFAKFLNEDKAKRDFLLGFLVSHEKNVVDNLSAKDNLTFSDVKQRLLELDVEENSSHSTFATYERKGKQRSYDLSKSDSITDCTWCRKHHPKLARGHSWNQCAKLRAYKENQITRSDDVVESDEAHATVSNVKEVSRYPFYFDTCASSHMCPYADRFISLTPFAGTVKSSSGGLMVVKGKGTVVLVCQLRDGTISSFRLLDVLYVPQIERPLFSWRKIMSKGYHLQGENDILRISKENKTWIGAVFNGNLPQIHEITDMACLTYDFWYEALGHSAPSTMEKTGKLIQDDYLIPNCPSNFHCPACTIAKSNRSTPKPTTTRSAHNFEYIHSDVCGPFPVPSYSKASYFITFICDKSRYAWVRFLRNKSDVT